MSRITASISATVLLFAIGASTAFAGDPAQAMLEKEAKVTEAAARVTALATVPGGTISSAELEKEHGKLIWSFDIAQARSKNVVEIQVDAKTGTIVSKKIETPQKEAQEAAAEREEETK